MLLGLVVSFSVSFFFFCNLACCYTRVLYFYKTTLTGKFSEILFLYCIIFPFHSAICGVILGPYVTGSGKRDIFAQTMIFP